MGNNAFAPYRAADFVLRNGLRLLPPSRQTERAALWWGYRFQPPPSAVRLRSGTIVKTTHVDHLQLLLYYLGMFEPECVALMKRHLSPGGTLLDVGANIGIFSLEGAATVGPSGTVIAIEASPTHAQTIQEAAALNRFGNIAVAAVAVGSEPGVATLKLPRGGNQGMFTLGDVAEDGGFEVPVRTIDQVVGGRRIDFIKMDIEGSELKALKGAVQTLSTRPPIMIELNEATLNSCGCTAREVKEFLFDLGYVGRMVGSGHLVNLDQSHYCDECIFERAELTS